MTARPCRKRRYRDRVGALIALANTSRSNKAKRNEARIYRCPNCNGWHLTSEPKRAPLEDIA